LQTSPCAHRGGAILANARVHSSTACDFAVVVGGATVSVVVVVGGGGGVSRWFGFGSRTAKKSFIVGSAALRFFGGGTDFARDARSKYSSVDPAVDFETRSVAVNASVIVV
jgi:hypothetical protein